MEKSVIAEREKGLQIFLDVLQEYPTAMWQPEVLKFFDREDEKGTEFSGLFIDFHFVSLKFSVINWVLFHSNYRQF